MKKIYISQSNYIPWKGFFDSLKFVDVYVVYDDMQYTTRDWRNRNLIKTVQGLKWISIPVETKGSRQKKINEIRIVDKNWANVHWDILKNNYKQAGGFKDVAEWLEPLYRNCHFQYLTEINMHFIIAINHFFNIKTDIRFSSEFELQGDKTFRLVNICKELKGTDYYTGPAAKDYMQEQVFVENNIRVNYFDYSGYPEYRQLYPPFVHQVSVLDLIFNEGSNAINYLKNAPL